MQEIEAKILEIDVDVITAKLKELGATKRFEGHLEALYYDFPDRRLKQEKKTVRLRREGDSVVLAYKETLPDAGAKVMKEIEVALPSMEVGREILEGIGLQVGATLKKHRVEYALGDTHVVIDTFDGGTVPPFLEIEAHSIARIHEVAQLLGYSAKDCLPWSWRDVLKHYGQ